MKKVMKKLERQLLLVQVTLFLGAILADIYFNLF